MIPRELEDLQKALKKTNRIASEKAGELHDLVEERPPAAYHEIPGLAQETYEACLAWSEATARLKAAEAAALN